MMMMMITQVQGQGLRYSQQMFDAFDSTAKETGGESSCVALSVTVSLFFFDVSKSTHTHTHEL